MTDLILIILILGIPAIAQAKVMSSYNKYKKIANSKGISGFEVARKILDENGLKNVHVVETTGNLSDHYDPSRKVVRLSKDVFSGESVAAISIAAHECGHAIQDKEGYFYMKVRSFIYPIVNLGTSLSYILFFIGMIAQILDLIYLGIALVSLGLVFQIVTLPVEFNASSRAKDIIKKLNLVNNSEAEGCSKVLFSAALTYVAGVLSSALNIIRLLLAVDDRR